VRDAAEDDINVDGDTAMATKEADMRTADRQLKRDAKHVAHGRKVTKQNATEPESEKEPPAEKANTKTICIMHGGGKRGLKPGRPPKK
jgi:hypothetical protein